MSLKRKASFPPNVAQAIAGPSVLMDDAPSQYLNSRTRKRFRDDRPDDKTIYENTVRWLFAAQQRQLSTPCIGLEKNEPDNETKDMDSEPLPTPETVDPRQQTLFKFFKPAQSSPTIPSSHMASRRPGPGDNGFLQPYSLDVNLPHTAMRYDDRRGPSSSTAGTDVDVDMDMDSGSDQSTQDLHKRSTGGSGWM